MLHVLNILVVYCTVYLHSWLKNLKYYKWKTVMMIFIYKIKIITSSLACYTNITIILNFTASCQILPYWLCVKAEVDLSYMLTAWEFLRALTWDFCYFCYLLTICSLLLLINVLFVLMVLKFIVVFNLYKITCIFKKVLLGYEWNLCWM